MTNPRCERCEEPLEAPRDKDNRGWWRDKCMPCIKDVAYSPDNPTTPDNSAK